MHKPTRGMTDDSDARVGMRLDDGTWPQRQTLASHAGANTPQELRERFGSPTVSGHGGEAYGCASGIR